MKTVILAAGFGSRLWPLSTSEKPKQFQPLIEGKSPLLYTYNQLAEVIPTSELYVLGLEGMQDLIRHELPELDESKIILVPERRNTLPHTLWALNAITDTEDEPVLFKSVDHFVINPEAFLTSLKRSLALYDREQPRLTMLCTEYKSYNSNDGYCVTDSSGKVLNFLEKPTAAELKAIANGKQLYRSPFIYIASKHACLEILDGIEEVWSEQAKQLLLSGTTSREQAFLELPFLDISTAIFQQANQLWVQKIEYEYIDVGQFTEIYALNDKDSHENVIIGNVILGNDCHNCLAINNLLSPLVIMSLKNMVVVQTESGSLISPMEEASMIGEIYKTQIHGH